MVVQELLDPGPLDRNERGSGASMPQEEPSSADETRVIYIGGQKIRVVWLGEEPTQLRPGVSS